MTLPLRVLPVIAAAVADGSPVVALESSVLAQGLPIPANRESAEQMTAAIQASGSLAAVTAVVRGTPTVGLEPDELERFLKREGVRKVSARDIPSAMVARADGATTVAATLCLASLAGIAVFATGGIGGVHRALPGDRAAAPDESADLAELARTPMVVVCAGAKAILDIPATWERLETLGIPVVGYRTAELPGFYTADTGIQLTTTADTPEELAAIYAAHRALGRTQSVLVVQPPPAAHALPRDLVESAVLGAVQDAHSDGVSGAAATPYLLDRVALVTQGRSLEANLALLEQNAALAGSIAYALARDETVSLPTRRAVR